MLHHRVEIARGDELPRERVFKCYPCGGDGRVLSEIAFFEIQTCEPCYGYGEIILAPEDQIATC